MSRRESVRLEGIKLESLFDGDSSSFFESDDDQLSIPGSQVSGMRSRTSGTGERLTLAKNETRAVICLRGSVIFVLLSTALIVSLITFFYLRNSEERKFVTSFEGQAHRVIDSFQTSAQSRIKTIEAFSLAITSHAIHTNSSWPFVTFPDFERQGVSTAELAQVISILMVPVVTEEDRDQWERYSVANQGWLADSKLVAQQEAMFGSRRRISSSSSSATTQIHHSQPKQEPQQQRTLAISPIKEQIYRFDGANVVADPGPGPYLPQWQFAPFVDVPALVNFNLLSHNGFKDSVRGVLNTGISVVGRSFRLGDTDDERTTGWTDSFDLFLERYNDNLEYQNDPVADLHIPIYDGFDTTRRTLVGLLSCIIYWQTYFSNLLSDQAVVDVVLENNCNQKYTYRIDGPMVNFRGDGDLHERQFNHLGESTALGAFVQHQSGTQNVIGSCSYGIRVYPTTTYQDVFITQRPKLYCIVLLVVFIFTSSIFFLYDWLVEYRQRVVMKSAVQSNAIVSSLFPKLVRDQLLHREEDSGSETDFGLSSRGKRRRRRRGRRRMKRSQQSNAEEKFSGQNQLLKAMQKETHNNHPRSLASRQEQAQDDMFDARLSRNAAAAAAASRPDYSEYEEEDDDGVKPRSTRINAPISNTTALSNTIKNSRPIANLFDDCTVLFADIVGFTSWSSGRQPTDVFTLLEQLYGAFDKIAHKRHVFKVETIGDCYLAVTGLPEPQADHAVIMALFAHECLRRMRSLMSKELRYLVTNQNELSMRFGLHSGPVTAGVLRGEKSRFQLFGDTVNTAARMESTGQKNKIQVSKATAAILQNFGKANWLEERRDRVVAKGKGEMRTYWIRPRSYTPTPGPNDESDQQQQDQRPIIDTSENSDDDRKPASTRSILYNSSRQDVQIARISEENTSESSSSSSDDDSSDNDVNDWDDQMKHNNYDNSFSEDDEDDKGNNDDDDLSEGSYDSNLVMAA